MKDLEATTKLDRAAGVLLAMAAGDALGVPYEFATPPGAGELAEMIGGGLGNFAPGEWSDDTSMAVCIARVAATGVDLRRAEALDAIAEGFLEWYAAGPPDIGIQTSSVLGDTYRRLNDEGGRPAAVMTLGSQTFTAANSHSAGNGALMRTAPVALAFLDNRAGCAQAARAIASLTHADPLAGDSCVLWGEAIRVAVVTGEIDVLSGLDLLPDHQDEWRHWLEAAISAKDGGGSFNPNGFTVTALQAALAAVTSTPEPGDRPSDQLRDALHAAVRIGNDTDTVAAIAGGLLGARWGASAVPGSWRDAVHGWPGLRADDLVAMATSTVGTPR